MTMRNAAISIFIILFSSPFIAVANAQDSATAEWKHEWTQTDFSRMTVNSSEIISGGVPKDGIPAIDNPKFEDTAWQGDLGDKEPVIRLVIGEDARAYPLRILMYHEIVNDTVNGLPVVITYCPLCNAGLVFVRQVGGQILDFGTTGKLRHSDMVMYDRQTQSWWQQFTGEAMVGQMAGQSLTMLPSTIESYSYFQKKYPHGKVLVPNTPHLRPYGKNPYTNYDTAQNPFLLASPYDGPVPALERVVAIGDEAWPLSLLSQKKEIRHGDYILRWSEGQNSALDTTAINHGRDIGNVSVLRLKPDGEKEDVIYHIPFAFAFKAFKPHGIIHTNTTVK